MKRKIIEYNGIKIVISDKVYEPSDDTFLLAEVALREIDCSKKTRVLEVGCGTGLISIILNKKGCEVTACDISEDATKLALINAKLNKANVKIIKSDLLEAISGKFDCILFNPPYLPSDDYDFLLSSQIKIALVGGEKGNEVILRFIDQAPKQLKKEGKILLVLSSLSNIDEVMRHAEKRNLEWKMLAKKHFFFEDIYVVRLTKKK